LFLFNDVPLEIVSELLGHSSIKITQASYGKIAQRRVNDEMKNCLINFNVINLLSPCPANCGISLSKEKYKSSHIAKKQSGNCVEKSIILIACLRALGIPARLHLGKVKNHIAVERLTENLGQMN
jgi:hypothetical protein